MCRYIAYSAYMLTILLLSTSCIDYEDEEVAPNCVITSFSVGDITTTLHTQTKEGIDSSYTRTISGNSVKFNIDQVNGVIESVDSLPSWVDLTRVVPSIGCTGYLYVKTDTAYVPILGRGDSLDLSKPLGIMVMATDRVSARHYTAVIHRSTANADSLLWTKTDSTSVRTSDEHRLLVKDDMLYLFVTEGGVKGVRKSPDGESWSTLSEIRTEGISMEEIVERNGMFFSTATDGFVYSSEDGTEWVKSSDKKVSRLLLADKYYLYALDGDSIMSTRDMRDWTCNGRKNMEYLPEKASVTGITYPARTNANLQIDLMVGTSNGNTSHAVVWYKVSSDSPQSNQQWDYITVTEDNKYPLPLIEGLTAFYFTGAVYATGDDYTAFYKSDDNGITWHKVSRYQYPPEGLVKGHRLSATVWKDTVWMVQASEQGYAQVWKGRLNR